MQWNANAACHACHHADATHNVIYDGLQPPEPGKLYAFQCPLTWRLVVVAAECYEWKRADGPQCHPVELRRYVREEPPTQLLEFGEEQPY